MLELIALYITSIFLIGALALLGRHNQHTGWRRQRGHLVEEIQDSMDSLRTPQPAATATARVSGVLTPEAKVVFSAQLVNLQSRLAAPGAVPRPDVAVAEEGGRARATSESVGRQRQ